VPAGSSKRHLSAISGAVAALVVAGVMHGPISPLAEGVVEPPAEAALLPATDPRQLCLGPTSPDERVKACSVMILAV